MSNDGWGTSCPSKPVISEDEPDELTAEQIYEAAVIDSSLAENLNVKYAPDDETTLMVCRNLDVIKMFDVVTDVLTLHKPNGNWPQIVQDAVTVGDLSVHQAISQDEPGTWRVSHVPTSAKFDKALPVKTGNQRYSKKQLIEWAAKVQCEYLDDWALLATLTHLTYDADNDNILECKARIVKWCQEIKI